MSINLSYHNDLVAAKEAIEKLKGSYPEAFEKLVHVVNLTRSLQIKYPYLGSLIMNENPGAFTPKFLSESVLSLYLSEVEKLNNHPHIQYIQEMYSHLQKVGYDNLSLLVLGVKPESLAGHTKFNQITG